MVLVVGLTGIGVRVGAVVGDSSDYHHIPHNFP